MIDQEIKKKIFKKIDEFVNYQNSNKEPKRYELRFYVSTDIAKDRAEFFGYIYNLKHFNCEKIIDLTFGSGNLTSHLLLDNNVDFTTLVFNDKNIDDANFSDELNEIASDISDTDILNSRLFTNNIYDLIIFNPQFGGGSYPDGDLDIKRLGDEEFIFHNYGEDLETAFREKFDLSECTFTVDDDLKKIFIHSDKLSVKEMDKRYKKIKIFNYNDVFYQSKNHHEKGSPSKLIKFRKTLEKISDNETTVVFFGKFSDYKLFFSDFNKSYIYLAEESDKSIFIGQQSIDSHETCYIKSHNKFEEVECHKKNTNIFEDINLQEILSEIHESLKDLKALDGGELFVLDDKTGISTENKNIEITSEQEKLQKLRFKNFLLDYIIKEEK